MAKKIFIFACMSLLAGIPCSAAGSISINQDLVGYWAFDEGGGDTAYDLVGDNHGTLNDPNWTTGQIGGALEFDGNDYVEMIGYKGITGTDARSCVAWIKTDAQGHIISWGDESIGNQFWVFYIDGSGSLRVSINGGVVKGLDDMRDGLWHHVAAAWDSTWGLDIGNVKLYVDGYEITTTTPSGKHKNINTGSDMNVKVGLLSSGNAAYFDGLIDDVAVWERALSSEEVEQLYRDGLGDLFVVPIDDFEPSGEVGGPFTPSSIEYQLTNTGPNSISWDVAKTADWLDTSPASGLLDPNESVIVTVSLNTLAEALQGGIYTDTVTFTDITNERELTREVALTVIGPIIELSTSDFEFEAMQDGANPDDQILTIRNSGGGTLNWEITETCDWLTANPASGNSAGEPNDVTLNVDISGLALGSYNCQITISDPCAMNNPQYMNVTLDITGPIIDLSTYEFAFEAVKNGLNPDDQILTIRNAGGGILNWTVEPNHPCEWLTLSTTSGNSAGEPNDVTLSVDISGLGWGEYNCPLTVSDPCAMNSPQNVNVILEVIGPIIELSSLEFVFEADVNGLNPDDQVLTIRNSGSGTLNWEIVETCDWLTVDPCSGNSAGEPNDVTLSVDISGLGRGNYQCELTVSDTYAENSPRIVNVTLYVGSAIFYIKEGGGGDGTSWANAFGLLQSALDFVLLTIEKLNKRQIVCR